MPLSRYSLTHFFVGPIEAASETCPTRMVYLRTPHPHSAKPSLLPTTNASLAVLEVGGKGSSSLSRPMIALKDRDFFISSRATHRIAIEAAKCKARSRSPTALHHQHRRKAHSSLARARPAPPRTCAMPARGRTRRPSSAPSSATRLLRNSRPSSTGWWPGVLPFSRGCLSSPGHGGCLERRASARSSVPVIVHPGLTAGD